MRLSIAVMAADAEKRTGNNNIDEAVYLSTRGWKKKWRRNRKLGKEKESEDDYWNEKNWEFW